MLKASSPGKVLILGGYHIIEAPNVGISIGTTARFEAHVLSCQVATDGKFHLRVLSPQFGKDYVFECAVDSSAETSVCVTQTEGSPSSFLLYSILFAVTAALARGSNICKTVTLELLADNNFYSQRNYLESRGERVSVATLRTVPQHTPLVGEVSKTGLGSSAALTTSVVACLYCFLRGSHTETAEAAGKEVEAVEVEFLHRIAQIAHSMGQGKIGSGFDVYTATYGTCVYRRFPAHFLDKVMGATESPTTLPLSSLLECVNMERAWVEHIPFRLPEGLKLLLGDVHQGGSSTPSMASKVMAWRRTVESDPESVWVRLRDNNEKCVAALLALVEQANKNPVQHNEAVDALKQVVLSQHTPTHDAERLWIEASVLADTSRRLLREMGHLAQVEIEPSVLSALLDATRTLPGVFAVGCPGAGGYDAVFALVLGEETCSVVERFWEEYAAIHVCSLLVREDAMGLTFDQTNCSV